MWTIAWRSVRYSTLPDLESPTAFSMSSVTVPDLRVRHLPLGAEHAAEFADRRHHVRGRDGDVEVGPALFDFLRQVVAADEVGAGASASRACWPCAKTATVTSLPSPCGSARVPRSCSSAWRTLTPSRMCTSTVSSNLALAVSLTRRRLGGRVGAVAVDLVVLLAVSLAVGHEVSY
jgi:hypothetical protein